jgi:hypothetical protein
MALPLIVTPEYRTTIPSTEQEISYRPFLVKQEKVLLTAQESDDDKDQILAVAKVLSECITTRKSMPCWQSRLAIYRPSTVPLITALFSALGEDRATVACDTHTMPHVDICKTCRAT